MLFRIRLFLSHLFLSLIIGSLVAYTVFFVWYPGLLAKAMGVTHIFLLLLSVDVSVGPLLTLFLAKKGKKGLYFDLLIVFVFQMMALVYGVWHIAEGRPAWQIINVYRVELVPALELNYDDAKGDYSKTNWGKPKWAMVRPARDSSEQSERLWTELEGRGSPSRQAKLFVPYKQYWDSLMPEIKPLDDLYKYNAKENVLSELALYPRADGFLPMMGKSQDMVVLTSYKDEEIIAIVDLLPW